MNGFFHIPSDRPMSDNELREFFGTALGVCGVGAMSSVTDKIIIDRIAQIAIDLNLLQEPRNSFGVIDCPFVSGTESVPSFMVHGLMGPLGAGKSSVMAWECLKKAFYVPRRKHKPRNHIYARYFQRKGKIRL